MNAESRASLPTEKEDLLTTSEYLGIRPDGIYMLIISGLNPDILTLVLNGSLEESSNRNHTKIVGDLTRILRLHSAFTTGNPLRGEPAINWLETGKIHTSEGEKTPLEVFADTKLATETRDEAIAALS